MRDALGLEKDYVPGSSMKNIKKTDVVGAALAAPVQKTEESLLSTLKTELKEKSAKDKTFVTYLSVPTVISSEKEKTSSGK
ncbi:unnamed protein product [Strongylus vulgaris]|uniref:Uncharacterized protein n=1 Tax=Strongylus vulgaris TaxID=40348 RepID=A0A3P7IYV9_STRVU|nr:unnamed protein product [Strongylus vulgaris]